MDRRTDTRIGEICEALRAGAPVGWESITLEVWANVMAYEVAVSAQGAGGRFVGEMRQLALTEQFQILRDEMYEPDKGAWLSARFILRRTGDSEISFNFDEDPNWTPELHPMMFVRDLEAYPRADGHIPPWLRRLVDQGHELERQHEAAQDDQ